MNEEQRKKWNEQKAANLAASCGLKIIKGEGGKPKLVDANFKEPKAEDFFSGFKLSSETQPMATPFVVPSKKVSRDGMDV